MGRHELPRLPVELPKNSQLAHLEQGLSAVVVDEHILERLVHVVSFAREQLVVPDDVTGHRIEGQHAVRVQRIP